MSTDIYSTMRIQLTELIRDAFISSTNITTWAKLGYDDLLREQNSFTEAMIKATIPQLWALHRLMLGNPTGVTSIGMSGFGTDTYLGVSFCGMFVGIELDGHTHS